jgi:ABC-type multidrug transport system fused ATPase/permease subunit
MKHIGWYDRKEHAPAYLSNVISGDIEHVNGLTTEAVGIATEAGLGLLFSCTFCFIFSWEVGVVVTLASPFMILGGLGMTKLQFNVKSVDYSQKEANALLNDLIINYRTVISFGEKNV